MITKPKTSPTISCHDLTYHVGGKEGRDILINLSFTAKGGEIIGICGPNGAGKSTFLKALGGLIRPQQGQIMINGQPLTQIKTRSLARELSFLPQDTQVPFDFPSRDIVLMGRHPYAANLAAWSAADLAIVDRCMDAAECRAEADQLVTTLSGGERQRVMIARLLAQDTPIVLLDEMTANQDIRHASLLLDLAQRLAASGKLVIMVLHDLRAAARACSRVCLMHHGQIVADGEPVDVLHEGHIEFVYGIPVKTFINPFGEWDFDISRHDEDAQL
ncbi:MAG: ABC transporter ATP-binding protein [Eubacteriales bacterium]|nr:ABC transporter ATP-binding protein [Eubacteriales bacterium]